MSFIELSERFAHLWRSSREDAGKSQDYMARALDVSKKTVQNWEAGLSCPSQLKGFEWFVALDVQPMPYYLRILYPQQFERLSAASPEHDIDDALLTMIKDLTPEAKHKLLYLLSGEHGSSPIAMLELITAHLQTPLRDRLNIAQSVATNYEMAESSGTIKRPDHIQPNMELLYDGIENGKTAVKAGKNTYSAIKGGDL